MFIRNTSPIISIYRNLYTVESLERMHRVTGKDFAISGDAPLREDAHALKRMLDDAAREAAKAQLNQRYARYPDAE